VPQITKISSSDFKFIDENLANIFETRDIIVKLSAVPAARQQCTREYGLNN